MPRNTILIYHNAKKHFPEDGAEFSIRCCGKTKSATWSNDLFYPRSPSRRRHLNSDLLLRKNGFCTLEQQLCSSSERAADIYPKKTPIFFDSLLRKKKKVFCNLGQQFVPSPSAQRSSSCAGSPATYYFCELEQQCVPPPNEKRAFTRTGRLVFDWSFVVAAKRILQHAATIFSAPSTERASSRTRGLVYGLLLRKNEPIPAA